MSDTVLSYDDIADLRYDPFSETYTPNTIGYNGIDPEVRTIPSSAPYQIKLFEVPQRNTPSTTQMDLVIGGTVLREVSKTQSLSSGDYRVNYDELDIGKVEFHANQKGLQVNCRYYALGTINQKSAYSIQLNGVGGTIKIASSDSQGTSKTIADSIITVGQDAALTINTHINTLNAAGGGSIYIYEGNYTINTAIELKSNVSIIGTGAGTILKKGAGATTLGAMIDGAAGISGILLQDFVVDGDSVATTPLLDEGAVNFDSTLAIEESNIKLVRITSKNHINQFVDQIHGFMNAPNLNGCFAENMNAVGFKGCVNLVDCFAENMVDGYESCERLTNCTSVDSDKVDSGANAGFKSCNQMSNCSATGSQYDGFNNCGVIVGCSATSNNRHGYNSGNRMSSCIASGNGVDGYNNISRMSDCVSSGNTADGFQTCGEMSACFSESNVNGFDGCVRIAASKALTNSADGFASCQMITGSEGASNTGYGFNGCVVMGFNYATGNGLGQYNNSWADRATINAVNDTAAGGYNG